MKEVYKNLFIGSDADCHVLDFAVIHACKTCHQKKLDYLKSLPQTDEHYLIFENEMNLYLNLVDMNQEFHPKFTNPIFAAAINFIDKKIQDNKVLVHCNQGVSRSASIGLVYLANNGIIANASYDFAYAEFIKLYPDYKPGNGVMLYIKNNWDYLMRLNSN